MGPSKRKSTPAGVEESAEKATEGADGDVPPVKRVRIGGTSVVATTPTTEAEDEDPGERRKRQGRKRKKKIFSEILQQMEFYFSDANIAKSPFMQVRNLRWCSAKFWHHEKSSNK